MSFTSEKVLAYNSLARPKHSIMVVIKHVKSFHRNHAIAAKGYITHNYFSHANPTIHKTPQNTKVSDLR